MQGNYTIEARNSDVAYKFTLHRNFTILTGEGADGKTTLYDLISDYDNEVSGITVNVYSEFKDIASFEALSPARFRDGVLLRAKGQSRIFIVDEEFKFISSNDFAVQAQASGCYFILIYRDKLSQLSISAKEVYKLKQNSGHFIGFEQLYPNVMYGVLPEQKRFIIEDEGSGADFFKAVYGSEVITCAGGRSKISSLLVHEHSIVIADGAAFADEMSDVLSKVLYLNGLLIVLESFEYAILKSNIIHSQKLKGVDLDNPIVDSNLFISWEAFYTNLLHECLIDSYGNYNKSHLTAYFLNETNKLRILNVYDLPFLAKSQHTIFFWEGTL